MTGLNSTKDATSFLNEYAVAHDMHFEIQNTESYDYETLVKADSIDDLDVSDKEVDEWAYERCEEYINDNIEKYDITYHDYSDYDREYGYGEYGEYDGQEIQEHAERLAEDEFDKIFEQVYSVPDDYAKTGKGMSFKQWCDKQGMVGDKGEIFLNYESKIVGMYVVMVPNKPGIKHESDDGDDNKVISAPKSFDPSKIKKWRIVLRQTWSSGLDTFAAVAYGVDEEDAINYNKIKSSGWGVGVRLHSIKEIPGPIPPRVLKHFAEKFERMKFRSL